MAKRRKAVTPIALLWTRRDQRRFTDTAEKLVSLVNDLAVIVRELQAEHARRPRRKPAAAAPGATEGTPS